MELQQSELEKTQDTRLFENVITKDGKLKVEIYQRERFIKFNFVNGQNVHLNNSIRFSDMKAGALIAVNGTFIKFGYDLIIKELTWNLWIANVGILLLMVGILIAILVVKPQNLESKRKGIHYWGHITNYEQNDFVNTLDEMEISELLEKSLINNYSQSMILTKKFKKLYWAFLISVVGYAIFAAAIIISMVSNSI
jgi:Family of unknown function (DUF5706)